MGLALVSVWQLSEPALTPRQRDVQAAHRCGFWRGFLIGALIALLVIEWLVWWWLR